MILMTKNEYMGLGKLIPIVLVAGSLIGCEYKNSSVNEQGSDYSNVESRTTESKFSEKGLESKINTEEKSIGKKDFPEISYEKAMDFFKPEIEKAKASPEGMKNFQEMLKGDEELRNLMYAIYSNPRKFEEDNCKLMNKEISDFKKSPLDHITDERLSEIHKYIPFIPRTKKELDYLRDTNNLSSKQYGDFVFLIIDKHFSDLGESYFQGMIGIH